MLKKCTVAANSGLTLVSSLDTQEWKTYISNNADVLKKCPVAIKRGLTLVLRLDTQEWKTSISNNTDVLKKCPVATKRGLKLVSSLDTQGWKTYISNNADVLKKMSCSGHRVSGLYISEKVSFYSNYSCHFCTYFNVSVPQNIDQVFHNTFF